MDTPNMGELWVHIKTDNVYTVMRMCRLRHPDSGDWLIGVVYIDDKASDMFVRECFDDFMVKFRKVK